MSINNTKYGVGSLNNNTGSNNSAFGAFSAYNTTSDASCNTSVGSNSLFYNTSGQQNTAIGSGSLCYNTTGSNNTALGANALEGRFESSLVGNENVGIGVKSLYNLYDSELNTAIGFKSGLNTFYNSNNNTFLGAYTDISYNFNNPICNSTALGYNAIVDCSNQIMLGTSSENVCVPGSSTLTGVVNIGSYLKFPDGSTQNTSNGGTGPTGLQGETGPTGSASSVTGPTGDVTTTGNYTWIGSNTWNQRMNAPAGITGSTGSLTSLVLSNLFNIGNTSIIDISYNTITNTSSIINIATPTIDVSCNNIYYGIGTNLPPVGTIIILVNNTNNNSNIEFTNTGNIIPNSVTTGTNYILYPARFAILCCINNPSTENAWSLCF